jgi:GT2 family glycosyltransferase
VGKSRTRKPARTERICIGWIDPGIVHSPFVDSIIALITNRADVLGGRVRVGSGANVSKARNELVRSFLEHTDDDWLLMLDADLVFDLDAFDRLRALAQRIERPIVSGLYYAAEEWQQLPPGMTGLRPLIFDISSDHVFTSRYEFQHGEQLQVGGVPTGCLLVHRSVYERLDTSPYPWFFEQVVGDKWVSEDLTFCLVAQAAGFPVWVDTGAQFAHIKSTRLSSAMYAALGGPIRTPAESDSA